jgi:hypothetical protein
MNVLILLLGLLQHPFASAGFAVGAPRVAQGKAPSKADVERQVQRIAMQGWAEARALAPKGGAVALLGPVNARLKELDQIDDTSARYAETTIRAAVSAAQDEREEMALLLTHARDLSEEMDLIGEPAAWPLPIDEVEGELFLEVDQYADARAAYERATRTKPTPNAWIGLARAADKLGDIVTACRAYTTAGNTPNLPAAVELEMSVYALKCKL